MCAPIVREAEELDALIAALDEVLGGTPTPRAQALLDRTPVSQDSYAEPNATVNATTQLRVLAFVRSRDGAAVRAADVASALKIGRSVARVMLSRLATSGDIERSKRGEYRRSQR